jgi:hypothetical protein
LPPLLQKQCFISDARIVLSEFFSPTGGDLVLLASKWLLPDTGPAVLSTLKRLFQGEEPVVNAGLVLRELLTHSGSNDLPHTATIEALLDNVARNISHAARDDMLTRQLIRAARVPSIQSVICDFWTHKVNLVPSQPVVVLDLKHVTFSETTRMYVAPSDSMNEPVFEKYFQSYPLVKGPQLDFEHLVVPFSNASSHREGCGAVLTEDHGQVSMLPALVELGNIDIFGTASVRAIVQHKWQMFGLNRWVQEFLYYSIGLALLVVLCIRTWQLWSPQSVSEGDGASPVPLADAIIAALFCVICVRSAYRESAIFYYSARNVAECNGDSKVPALIWQRIRVMDFWHLLNFVHIALGISAAILVWLRSSNAVPVLAVTSFVRWWGTLFYLQECDCEVTPALMFNLQCLSFFFVCVVVCF